MIKYINYVVLSYFCDIDGNVDKHRFAPIGYFQSQEDALKFMRSNRDFLGDLFLGKLDNSFMIYSHL